MSNHKKLFDHSQPASRDYPSLNTSRLSAPSQYKAPIRKKPRQFPAISTTAILIVLGLALEAFAPLHFQPSTFLAIRGGQLQGKKAEVASKKEAIAQAHIKEKVTVAESDVLFAQDCRINKQKQANSAWGECMSSGQETSIVCDIKRDQINSIECPEIPR